MVDYTLHESVTPALRAQFNWISAALSWQAVGWRAMGFISPEFGKAADSLKDTADLAGRLGREHPKRPFGIEQAMIGGGAVAVREETVLDKPFCRLLHFKAGCARNVPKVLLVAPTSGHFATVMREMVETLLPDHDVYITDWKNPRDVPVSDGTFGFDDYVGYLTEFMQGIPDVHVVGYSQSTQPVMAATALMNARKDKAAPVSMTLMAGPVDARAARSPRMESAQNKSLSWYQQNVLSRVPNQFPGAGRVVQPGFNQLYAFASMMRDPVIEMSDEMLTVCDIDARLYLDTIDRVFHRHLLALGKLDCAGERIRPETISRTALLTMEGGRDMITPPGQTQAAHYLCRGLKSEHRYHYLSPKASHHAMSHGPVWRNEILPRYSGFVRMVAEQRGIGYDPVQGATPVMAPEIWQEHSAPALLRRLHTPQANDNSYDRTPTQPPAPDAKIA